MPSPKKAKPARAKPARAKMPRKRKREPSKKEMKHFLLCLAEAVVAMPAVNSDFEARRQALAVQMPAFREYLV